MKLPVSKTITEIAELLNGRTVGDGLRKIDSINRIEDAGKTDATFLADLKYLQYLENSDVACVIVNQSFDLSAFPNQNFILVEDPRKAFNLILNYLNEIIKNKKRSFIHPTAVIGENCKIAETAYIGAFSVIGDNCEIADSVVINPGVVLYDNVKIGKNSILNSKVVCYDEVEIGEECILHSGVVIGADGFGYEEQKDGVYIKIPQLGNVRIGNRVELGANTTIDRALLGSTVIEDGVKLDNLIQIGHNVFVGENTAMASQVGISGSTKIGKRNRIGGQSGLAGHIQLADDVILLARTGVSKSIDTKGMYFGAPAKERMKAFKIEAVINNLPDMKRELTQLRQRVEKIENK